MCIYLSIHTKIECAPSVCRSEYDGDLQSQLLSKANEEDKNCSRALSVVSAVVRAAKDLLQRAFAVDGKGRRSRPHKPHVHVDKLRKGPALRDE